MKPERDPNVFYISYSGQKTYLVCPAMYQFRYIQRIPRPADISSSIVGSTVGVLFQWFYEKKLWSLPNVQEVMESKISDAVSEAFTSSKVAIDLDLARATEMKIPEYIRNGIRIIREHRLLRTENRAEVDLTICKRATDTHPVIKLGGRADFILSDPSEIIIIDGKASLRRAEFVDSDQLIWYALQHYLKYQKAPDRLGFLFWAFPEEPMKWVDYNEDDLRSLYKRTLQVVTDIRQKKFPVQTSSQCKVCDYRDRCPEGDQYVRDMNFKESAKVLENSIFDLETF